MDINTYISTELNLNIESVRKAIEMIDEGKTIPFIARYRKEQTGGLTDENLRDLEEKLVFFRNLDERKKTIYNTLDTLNIHDEELLNKIENCFSLTALEDLYRPYKPKKVTRASKAIKAGLKPVATYIQEDKTGELNTFAFDFICDEYKTVDKVIQGALDILAEEVADRATFRTFIKDFAFKTGELRSSKIEGCESNVFDNYADYSKKLSYLKSYNILAINRGVNKKCLTKKIVLDDEYILKHISTFTIPSKTPYTSLFNEMIADSYSRLIYPSVCNDIFSDLMEKASIQAIEEFKSSLKATLLFPPVKNKRVLGFDPGFSHGCKLAFIDEQGKVIDTFVLENPFFTERNKTKAIENLYRLIIKNRVNLIALGNGTASRESEALLKTLKEQHYDLKDVEVAIVSESGASIWSATEDANKEFPEFEPNLRSAVSIARRLQDPLAELVKIPPESIGVGQYQYDIDEKKLSLALNGVVEDCVNAIGVNLNTASKALLSHISGLNSKVSQAIVSYRDEHGAFKNRKQLLKVPSLGAKAFENCAGFLRIIDGDNMLDNTSVHPESYDVADKLLSHCKGKTMEEKKEDLKALTETDINEFSKEFNVGIPTLKDIVKELIQPSRDIRETIKTAKLKQDITDIKHLSVGMILEGTIRNVTGFGFFVDLGVEINGLVYISEISNTRVEDPHKFGKCGDIVKVKIISIDMDRKRISLSMKNIKQED